MWKHTIFAEFWLNRQKLCGNSTPRSCIKFWYFMQCHLLKKRKYNYFQICICDYNPGLDKKFGRKCSNPVKLDRKRKVWHVFLSVFNWYWQSLSSWRETRHWAMCPPKFEIFLIFPNFFSRSATCEAARIPSLLY